jgi:hypothetical protein
MTSSRIIAPDLAKLVIFGLLSWGTSKLYFLWLYAPVNVCQYSGIYGHMCSLESRLVAIVI